MLSFFVQTWFQGNWRKIFPFHAYIFFFFKIHKIKQIVRQVFPRIFKTIMMQQFYKIFYILESACNFGNFQDPTKFIRTKALISYIIAYIILIKNIITYLFLRTLLASII